MGEPALEDVVRWAREHGAATVGIRIEPARPSYWVCLTTADYRHAVGTSSLSIAQAWADAQSEWRILAMRGHAKAKD